MAIKVRTKELEDGRLSLYLDFYPAVKQSNGRFTRREFLNRYLFKKPKNETEKRMNIENKHFAESVRLKREKGMLNEIDDIFNSSNKNVDFLKFFQKLTEQRKESQGNYGNWLSAFQYIKSFTNGTCKMGDIDEAFCDGLKNYLLKTDKHNTVKGLKLSQNSALSYFNKFRAAINEAFESRLINQNPLKYVKGIKQIETKREFLTAEEIQKLISTECDLKAIKNVALFSAFTGLRWSDISKLCWKDIQKTETGFFLHIMQKKTKDSILHPINEKSIQLLGKKGSPNERIFEGLKYSDHNNDILKRWILRAGINKKITLHNFRHTYATLLLNKGVDIFTVSKMLGHKDIKTTMLYSKVLTETKINAANLIDFDL